MAKESLRISEQLNIKEVRPMQTLDLSSESEERKDEFNSKPVLAKLSMTTSPKNDSSAIKPVPFQTMEEHKEGNSQTFELNKSE